MLGVFEASLAGGLRPRGPSRFVANEGIRRHVGGHFPARHGASGAIVAMNLSAPSPAVRGVRARRTRNAPSCIPAVLLAILQCLDEVIGWLSASTTVEHKEA